MQKDINEMTDEEIGALTPEELAELTAGIDLGGEGGEGEGGEGDEGEEGLTEEALAELLSGQEDEPQTAVAYARFKEKVDEANDLRLMLRAALQGRQQEEQVPAAPAPPQPPEEPKVNLRELRMKLIRLQTTGTEEEIEEASNALADAEEQVLNYRTELATYRAEAIADRKLETRMIADVAADAERSYPFLNPKDKSYDEAAALAVNAKARELMVSKGMRGSEALRQAVDTIGKRFATLLGSKSKDPGPTVQTKKRVDPRVLEALRRAGVVRHPPAGSGHGMRTTGVNLDIAKIPDKDLPKPGTAEYDRLIGKV